MNSSKMKETEEDLKKLNDALFAALGILQKKSKPRTQFDSHLTELPKPNVVVPFQKPKKS